jgi:acylphosphatase
MKHLSIRVSGKVQGVFFRASTKEKHEEIRHQGNVRNNADGSVAHWKLSVRKKTCNSLF